MDDITVQQYKNKIPGYNKGILAHYVNHCKEDHMKRPFCFPLITQVVELNFPLPQLFNRAKMFGSHKCKCELCVYSKLDTLIIKVYLKYTFINFIK